MTCRIKNILLAILCLNLFAGCASAMKEVRKSCGARSQEDVVSTITLLGNSIAGCPVTTEETMPIEVTCKVWREGYTEDIKPYGKGLLLSNVVDDWNWQVAKTKWSAGTKERIGWDCKIAVEGATPPVQTMAAAPTDVASSSEAPRLKTEMTCRATWVDRELVPRSSTATFPPGMFIHEAREKWGQLRWVYDQDSFDGRLWHKCWEGQETLEPLPVTPASPRH